MSSSEVIVVALLADPDAPSEIARRLAEDLPARLSERSGDGRRFDVEVISEPFTSGSEDPPTLMRRIVDRASSEKWDVVVALTELPLHTHGQKLVTDLNHEHRLALLSLPTLGGMRLQARTRRAVEEIVLSLIGPPDGAAEQGQLRLGRFISRFAPVHEGPVGTDDGTDLRYVVTGRRGHLRVLAGMVRSNQPWRLLPGLSKAFAAALAAGAIASVNTTIWDLAQSLGTPRLIIAMVGSVALMMGWLIIDAHLWHRTAEDSPEANQKTRLYNTSTVITLAIGVLACYAGLFVINILWALFIIDDQVWASTAQTSLGAHEFLTLAWLVASVATVGGALGSGLESDKAIRAAAYSKREQERRHLLQEDPDETP